MSLAEFGTSATGHAPEKEPLLAVEGLTNPGDFEDVEDNHSFRVQELDGVFLMLISMIGKTPAPGEPPQQDREPAMFQMQYTVNANTADAAFVLNDSKQPVSIDRHGTMSGEGDQPLLDLAQNHKLRCFQHVLTDDRIANGGWLYPL